MMGGVKLKPFCSWICTRTPVGKKLGSSQQTSSTPLSCHSVRGTLYLRSVAILILFSREGQTLHVLANELVPGDVVKFQTGDRVPADIRIIDSIDLEIDESSLTGETEARKKNNETCRFEGGHATGDPVALAERTCMAFMGTLVRNGEDFVATTSLSLVLISLGQVEALVLSLPRVRKRSSASSSP